MSKGKSPDGDFDLFAWGDSQGEHLERVRSRIGWVVIEFCEEGRYFHAQDLRDFVVERLKVAPASPDRILRDLRQRGLLNYEVIDRRASYYHVLPVGPQEQPFTL
jgi:hypothetical protein